MIWEAIWDGLIGFLVFGLLGFLLGLGLVLFIASKGLLKREKPLSKALVVLFWIMIPLFTSWEFAALKTIHSIESTAKGSSDLAIDQLEASSFPTFHAYVTENVNQLTVGNKLPSNEELAEAFYESSPSGSSWISKSVLVWLLDLAEEVAEENVAEQTGLEQSEVHAFRLLQDDAMDGVFSSAMTKLKASSHRLIGAAFFPYYFITVLIWVGCMLLPTVEIIRFARNKKRQTAA